MTSTRARTLGISFILANLAFQLFYGSPAWSWGANGHAIIARNAVKLLPSELRRAFAGHDADISHYSVVPDIVWKPDPGVRAIEQPVHYLNSENFVPSAIDPRFPSSVQEARQRYRAPADKPALTFEGNGTLPWRAQQFQRILADNFDRARRADNRRGTVQAAKSIGLNSGLLAHSIGDATQPFHSTYNHNGRSSGHSGIHQYFEDRVLDVLAERQGLERKSLALARQKGAAWRQNMNTRDPAGMTLGLLRDSFPMVQTIHQLDTQYALIPGQTGPSGRLARRPAGAVAVYFADVIEDRLALASVSLAALIEDAWIQAGRPTLRTVFGKFLEKPPYIYPRL